MRPRLKILLPIALLYGVFVSWYTDFGGPLSEDEIQNFLGKMQNLEGADEQTAARLEQFMREDTGRQFFIQRKPARRRGGGTRRDSAAAACPLHGIHDPESV